jgi:archaellum component FlaC
MMAESNNLFLAYLPLMRAQLDRIERKLEDVVVRLGYVEQSVTGHSAQLAEIHTKHDHLEARVTRIEKRLDLVED